ncbi:hypothetical protein ACHAXA_008262 [Cyclostephanos tholiformis]|uniref:Uncharacterized protein n=1 Tax=Cyclostephanos tholiformis TaxID=382380 RepID=A0ABD3RBD8_9STRA
MAIPGVFYWGSNTLLFVALSKLTVPIFQVAYQGKLVITALVSVCTLGRTYVARQWCCLVVISLSIAFIASEDCIRNNNTNDISETNAMTTTAVSRDISPDISGNLFMGLGAIAIACLLSAFAGVYFEYVVKNDRSYVKTPSLWMRNIQLAFFSIIVALFQLKLNGWSGKHDTKSFFHGFTYAAWCQVFLFSAGGLVVAAVIQHADNVVKGLATGISVLLSTAGSTVLFKTSLTPTFSICAVTTITAVYLFYGESISWPQRSLWTKYISALASSFAIINLITPAQDNEMAVPNHLVTNVFPTDWNSTTTALDALRSIQNQVHERHFHEATHILYDLRTAIGNRPAKYLEIGSYTGISAALMLRHPMPTFVTLVDPCVLDPSHFHGYLSQEKTIRKNLQALTVTRCCAGDFHPWDLRVGYSPQALPMGETFDIIFIDGDHSTRGVWADYDGTINLLRPGGFMVFDDYLDHLYSPAVRPAVDDIASSTKLITIGSPRNIHGIHPTTNQSFINEYIFQRSGKFNFFPQPETDVAISDPLLGITVATYRRPDGMTPSMLENLWTMLLDQSYRNWKLYLTGDFYENETEWKSLSFFNHSQASLYNLPEPGERGIINDLWLHAGTDAMNNALDRIVADGIQWNVHLDDDDIWDADHLQNVVSGIRTGATFVTVECQHHNSQLPNYAGFLTNISHSVLPRPCGVLHSSISFNAVKLTSRYKITPGCPADADLWSRIVFDDYFFPAFVPIKSCYHVRENGSGSSERVLRRWDFFDRDPPPGWYKNASHYTSLASETFPVNLSTHCVHIIGPQMNPPEDYSHHFVKLPLDMVPYHIRVVEAFAGLPVWQKQQ